MEKQKVKMLAVYIEDCEGKLDVSKGVELYPIEQHLQAAKAVKRYSTLNIGGSFVVLNEVEILYDPMKSELYSCLYTYQGDSLKIYYLELLNPQVINPNFVRANLTRYGHIDGGDCRFETEDYNEAVRVRDEIMKYHPDFRIEIKETEL